VYKFHRRGRRSYINIDGSLCIRSRSRENPDSHSQPSFRVATASLELTTDGNVFLEDEVAIEPSRYALVNTGIDEKGEYTLTIALDGHEDSYTFDIADYDLSAGSNTVIWIREDEIEFGQEQ
jgi:hypothetical protein